MNEMKPENEELTEVALCPSCFHPNPPEIDFCWNCGRPMGIIATYGPLERIYAQGWLYRKAVSEPTRFILIGIWLIFGSTVLSLPFFIIQLLPHFREFYFPIGSYVFIWSISAAILYRTTRKYFATKRKPPPWENVV